MKNYKYSALFITFVIFSFLNLNAQELVKHPKTEFRGVWIATVVNIDWPKTSSDSVDKQKADYIEILDTYQKLNFNAVIVQIRSVGDAFYPTKLAPWSKYLTGKEGKAPVPYYDPLEWMITEAHRRGFEFHAWMNPYRATMNYNTAALSPDHDFFKYPEWMIKYGGKYYYNPALPEVQKHLLTIVDEVVQNYDIDAMHFDDYFYPYKVAGEKFNDTASYEKYGKGMSIDDWRRDNVNTFVKDVSVSIKKSKPWVQFGISPFGVWRNKSVDPRGSDTEAGQTNYDDLYADPIAWMDNKWIDYLVPQLYWSMDHPKASYSKLLKWWSENSNNTAIYIGNGTYKINADSDKRWNNPLEIPNQIDITRSYKNVQGNAYFSAKGFVNKNQKVTKLLSENQYKYPALPPVVPAAVKNIVIVPAASNLVMDPISIRFDVQRPLYSKIRYVVVYAAPFGSAIDSSNPSQIVEKVAYEFNSDTTQIIIPSYKMDINTTCAITFIDYYGNESQATIVDLKQ
ncbi:uncharacterized lipoprotein YddW (UPF0748 family) [Flavobacterium sp. PL11]|uniref:glycoside hydrolase family 10 protein n=1 Tax=Flavobacterium sp. PL11 TaxID=3071717 RepID=UPI002E0C0D33|nr:uncharacterized lipoprotein YddW (UPF0748 family) [Flavobacterium sp. PL11]